MADFISHRRFYLSKRYYAKERGEDALSALWQGKQEAQAAGTALPEGFPSRAELALVGYTATEDLVGADEYELAEWVGLSARDSRAVLAAAAAL